MTIELVGRLRDYYTEDETRFHIEHAICDEAADEIERLREQLELTEQAHVQAAEERDHLKQIPSPAVADAAQVELARRAADVCQHWWDNAARYPERMDEMVGKLDAALKAATP